MKERIKNIYELEIFVHSFLKKLKMQNLATIITLSGDLGVGKTAFTKAAARFFDIKDDVTSPTFVIQKEYEIINHPFFKKMIHIDAYRLEDKSELEYLKWSENIYDYENIIFMEWPEQVEGIDIPKAYKIHIEILDDESREITIKHS